MAEWTVVDDHGPHGEQLPSALVLEDEFGYSVITWPQDDVWPEHWEALCALVARSVTPTGDNDE